MNPVSASLLGIIVMGLIIAGVMAGCPTYNVYSRHMQGEVQLAQAEIERAKGVAQANAIIAESLKGNESYLRYLWITEVATGHQEGKTVVYIPTEANMPILEASRKP